MKPADIQSDGDMEIAEGLAEADEPPDTEEPPDLKIITAALTPVEFAIPRDVIELVVSAADQVAIYRREAGLPAELQSNDVILLLRMLLSDFGIEELVPEDQAVRERWGHEPMNGRSIAPYNQAQIFMIRAKMILHDITEDQLLAHINGLATDFALVAKAIIEMNGESEIVIHLRGQVDAVIKLC